MFALLSQIVFMQPIILSALLALPVLWYLLRVTPPAPRTIIFPATRFLVGLIAEEQTPSKAPWWILLLRLLMVALIIIALARPVINPADTLPGQEAFRLVIDNGWASAQVWDQQIKAAEEAITQAGREKRDLYILATTPPAGEKKHQQYGPLTPGAALSIVRGLTPNPWPANYEALGKYLIEIKEKKSIQTMWLSHGLDEGNIHGVVNSLQNQGGLTYISPSKENLPLLLRPTKQSFSKKDIETQSDVKIDIDSADTGLPSLRVKVQAVGKNASVLDIQGFNLDSKKAPLTVFFHVIDTLKDHISNFQIQGRKGAGAKFLLDEQFKKRKVGIAAVSQTESSAPLIESSYYIIRALEPYADLMVDDIPALIEEKPSVIVLPDIAGMPTDVLNSLEKWIKDGGLLLRFSGPNMADAGGEQFLLPVTLRAGGRSLSGSLSWEEPQTIAAFSEDSPFYGLDIPEEIKIRQQVLADPDQDLENKVWARLSDGTPFITSSPVDNGLIVLIHTTANTNWSDFALSGLYVSVLKRIVQMAGSNNTASPRSYTSLDPLVIMDGYGGLVSPPPFVKPIAAENMESLIPSPEHPPGLYGQGNFQFALNIGSNLPRLQMTSNLPLSVFQDTYQRDYEIDIMPFVLYTALILFCLDWLIMIFVIGTGLSMIKRQSFSIGLLCVVLSFPAAAADNENIQYSMEFYLAYIKTGDTSIDGNSHAGLENLAETLRQRTSVEPAGVVGLTPEIDTLSFFPVIYWPISANQKAPSNKALRNIQSYLDHGGTILFDTRDQNQSKGSITNTENSRVLRGITASLNIPPIAPISEDHVLGRSFYLLKEYPGYHTSGTLWVEKQSVSGRDNVSSVLIGSNDWATAWAEAVNHRTYRSYGSNYDSQQSEMALRFGVNLVMYALTGNYKADQVHIPHILERLGR